MKTSKFEIMGILIGRQSSTSQLDLKSPIAFTFIMILFCFVAEKVRINEQCLFLLIG